VRTFPYTCPHCKNDDISLMEMKEITKKRDRQQWIIVYCMVCSKEFARRLIPNYMKV
jgi:hypothetical protein